MERTTGNPGYSSSWAGAPDGSIENLYEQATIATDGRGACPEWDGCITYRGSGAQGQLVELDWRT
jgi:hypothetical protein